jgi:hypothetical protein
MYAPSTQVVDALLWAKADPNTTDGLEKVRVVVPDPFFSKGITLSDLPVTQA